MREYNPKNYYAGAHDMNKLFPDGLPEPDPAILAKEKLEQTKFKRFVIRLFVFAIIIGVLFGILCAVPLFAEDRVPVPQTEQQRKVEVEYLQQKIIALIDEKQELKEEIKRLKETCKK